MDTDPMPVDPFLPVATHQMRVGSLTADTADDVETILFEAAQKIRALADTVGEHISIEVWNNLGLSEVF